MVGCKGMNVLINTTILILVIMEYFSFYYTIFRRELKKLERKQLILCGIIFVCIIGVAFEEWRLTPLYFIGLLLSAGLTHFIFEVSLVDIFKLYIIAYPALSILESIVVYVFRVTVDIGEKENAIVCMICIIIVFWLYYILFGKKLDRDVFYMTKLVWLIVSVVMFLVLGLISYFTYILAQLTGMREKKIGLILITAGGLAIFILIYVMIYYFNTKQKYQTQRDFLEQYNEQQKKYFEDLLRKEQETRQFRHDITAHLIQIQNLCEKGDYKEEKQYIEELLDEIILVNKKGYCVGNDIIDTILNTYLSPIASFCTIKVKGYVDCEIGISKKDLCVIVSNLVKNAVEAVEQCIYEPKEIVFEVNQGKQFLSIKVKNTADTEKITIQNKYPVTRKKNKRMHGLGIKNVKVAVEMYHGSYQYRIENGYYIAEVQLQI